MIDLVKYGLPLAEVMERYNINTPLRKAHFLAQIDHESTGLKRMTESLNYTVEALMATFSRKRISAEECRKFGRTATQKANQKAIANIIYGGEWGRLNLGNTETGDGWKFRGRGALMCTGRANYRAYMKDAEANPELLTQMPYAIDFAGWFWQRNKLNELASQNDIIAITKRINGGLIGIDERKKKFNYYLNIYKDVR